MSKRSTVVFAMVSGFAVLNCTVQGGDLAEEAAAVAVVSQESVAFNLTWQRPAMPLKICTERDPGLSLNDYQNFRSWMFDALDETWGTVPGMSFDDVGGCGPFAYDMKVTLKFGTSAWGVCGVGADCVVAGHDQAGISTVAVHEIGHGLGLHHEHQSPEATPLCEEEQAIKDACEDCLSTVPCQMVHFNTCFKAAETSDVTLTPQQEELAEGAVAARTPDSSAYVLTAYDPRSIMNYCAVQNGRTAGDYSPTALDLLGMEMLYPANRSYRIGCESACLLTGEGVVIRSNGSVTSEWQDRGGVDVAVRRGGQTYPDGIITASDFSVGVTAGMSYEFKDPWQVWWTGGGELVKDDSLHAAIVASVVN